MSLLLAGFATASLSAQDDAPEELDAFISEEVPIEENILPTSRPFNSVYGTDRSILDTPRNVTIISREQLDAIAIKDVRDFSKLTSSSYTKTNFGSPSTPNLRGQEADLFVNGMRRGGSINGNGLPINFNAVESVNIVKGPAGVVYGTTNYLGGYVDLISKRPFFDQERGSVGVSYGSYDQYTLNVDYSKPVSDKFAWRVSYEMKEWDGYWEFWKHNSNAVYLSTTFKASDTYTIETWAEYFVADYTENWGINRVTQDLVDNGNYLINAQTDEEYAAYAAGLGSNPYYFDSPFDVFFAGSNDDGVLVDGDGEPIGIATIEGVPVVPGDTASTVGFFAGVGTFVPLDGTTVPVDRSWKLAAPGDDSFGKMFALGVDQTFDFSDTFQVVNKTYYSWKDRQTFSSYHYSELLRDNISFDNRTEFRFSNDLGNDSYLNINTGIRFRYDDIWAVNHFFNEPASFWDMTRDPDTRRVPDAGFAAFRWIPDEESRGVLDHWYYGSGGHSESWIVGPFAQFDYKMNEKFSLLAGFTTDFVSAESFDPVLGVGETFDFGGFVGEEGPDPDLLVDDSTELNNYNFSAVYKATENISYYATYNFSETYDADTGGRVTPDTFGDTLESELFEVGAKFSLMDGKFFLGTAYVDREFTSRNQDGSIDPVYVEAFEIEFNYQPNASIFMTMGYSYTDATRTVGFNATEYTADRFEETGGIFVSPTLQGAPDGLIVEAPGIPDHLINGLFNYKWQNGFGVTAGFLAWDGMQSGYEGYDIIVPNIDDPANPYIIDANTASFDFQYEIDLTLLYEKEDWSYKLTFFNVTDEENWDVNNSGYGNDSVLARLPARYEISAQYSF
ncbi:MAG: TonB-dependent receptor plug domain-containing protein [Verrucomicrobiota bacterium]